MALIDKSGNPIPNKTYTLYGAWLQQVNELTVNLTSAGEILEQQATIAYQYWRITA